MTINNSDLAFLAKAWGPVLRDAIEPLRREIAELKARPTMTYRGVWNAGEEYTPGAVVTDQGSLWTCREATGAYRPGTSPHWQLMCKAGGKA